MTIKRDVNAVTALTTVADEETAKALALALVTERLAACVHILPKGVSVYWWEEKIEAIEEWTLLIKTEMDKIEQMDAFFGSHHVYAVPELLVMPVVAGHEGYLSWMHEVLIPKNAPKSNSPDSV
jgi:periplasmic divalent cation tolerance protein